MKNKLNSPLIESQKLFIHQLLDEAEIWHFVHSDWYVNDKNLHCIHVYIIPTFHDVAFELLSDELPCAIIEKGIDEDNDCWIQIFY